MSVENTGILEMGEIMRYHFNFFSFFLTIFTLFQKCLQTIVAADKTSYFAFSRTVVKGIMVPGFYPLN